MNEVQRFVLEELGIRGAIVRLAETWQQVIAQHHYPSSVQQLLGESVAATVLLATGLKGRPSISLQMQGDGPVKLLLVQCSGKFAVRGMAQWRSDRVGEALLGEGRLAVNVDPGEHGRQFQGIVPLSSTSLDACLESYFTRSEQLPTRFYLRCDGAGVGGLMLQALPSADADANALATVGVLAATVTAKELGSLDAAALLTRLFVGHTLRLFGPRDVTHDCRCTSAHLARIIRMLGAREVRSILEEQGRLEITCEFCNRSFAYEDEAVGEILAGGAPSPPLH